MSPSFTRRQVTKRATELLEQATGQKVGWVISLGVEPGFDSLRAEHRFQKLAERVGITSRRS